MEARPIFYDTETTGIKPECDKIVEIAAYDPYNDKSLDALVNPGMPIPKEASNVHHITDDMVKDAPSFKEIGQQFIDFCSGDVILIAHNNDNFDIHFLRNEFKRHDLEMPKWRFFDTLKWARRYRPDLPRHPLQFLREIYGIEANSAHRALDDVIVLYQVFKKMSDDLTIEQAYSLLCAPRDIKVMPFGKYQGRPLAEIPEDYINWLKKSEFFEKPENLSLKRSFEKLGLFAI